MTEERAVALRALREAAHLARLQIRADEGDLDAMLDWRAAVRSSSIDALVLFHGTVAAAKATGAPFSYLEDLDKAAAALQVP